MNLSLLLRTVWREARGARGRLVFFASCVAVGVMAVVGVAALVDAIELGLRARSRELLGGDLALESRRPLLDVSPYLPAWARDAPRVNLSILPTMVHGDRGQSLLVEVKAVDQSRGRFPLAGELSLEPRRPLSELLDDQSVLVAPELLRELGLARGDTLHVGGLALRITGVVQREPDPLAFSMSLGPRIFVSHGALLRTDLLSFGNRVRHRTVLAFPRGISQTELATLKAGLVRSFPGADTFVRVETHTEAQPALRSTLERVQRYMGLVALLSLLVASIGVAQIVSSWLAQAAPDTAVLRCMGFRPRDVLSMYLVQILLVALVGSLVGALAGAAVPGLVSRFHPALLPPDALSGLPLLAMARGVLLGVFVALVFSLPALTAVWKVSPARVLRSDADPLPVPRGVRLGAFSAVFAVVCLASYFQSRHVITALAFSAGVFALGLALMASARGLLWAMARLPRGSLPATLWHGAAALRRPGAGTTSSIVALGMGTLVVLSIALVDIALGREIHTVLPPHAPSVFLLDIQPDQWPHVQSLATQSGARHVESVPVIMARLSAIDGRPVEQLIRERPGDRNEQDRSQWVLTREQRVTTYRALPPDNQIVAGRLWSDSTAHELSLEQDFARDLGARVGSTITLDVQGVPVDFRVTSLRSVVWRSFAMNFFIVAEPGALDDAPHFRMAGLRFSPTAEQAFQDELARSLPNVTVLRVESLIARAAETLDQVALAVQLLGSFAIVTGFVILIGSVASTQLKRAREAAVLKVLGVTRAHIALLFALEHALSGLVAGTIGALGAYVLTFVFMQRALEMTTLPSATTCLVAVLLTSALAVVGGLLASARALVVPPLQVFRRHAE